MIQEIIVKDEHTEKTVAVSPNINFHTFCLWMLNAIGLYSASKAELLPL